MKTWMTLTAAMTTLCGLAGDAAACPRADLVNSWYIRYLHRPAEPCGLTGWLRELNCHGPIAVQAGILGSDEYFGRCGCCPRQFVINLHIDVLGQPPCPCDLNRWLGRLRGCGCRVKLAREFLLDCRGGPRHEPPLAVAPVYPPTNYAVPVVPQYYAVPTPPPVVVPSRHHHHHDDAIRFTLNLSKRR